MSAKSSPPPPAATDGTGPESAAAQAKEDSRAGDALQERGSVGTHIGDTHGALSIGQTPAPSAAPTDDELIKDIEKRVKRRDFDSAFDLARGIQDQDLHVKTVARIDRALAFVAAKAAAK
jgi:hypothetical protein